VRDLKAGDTDLTPIAVGAALSLPPSTTGTPIFTGVMIDNRLVQPASDSVVRATGFLLSDRSTGRPVTVVRCSIDGTRGQPCPTQSPDSTPPTWSFLALRSARDSAYVGVRKVQLREIKDTCLALAKVGGHWTVVGSKPIGNATHCGR
jgi:hypothetical protein